MNARGFLGTNASLVSDLSLVLGVLVALTLTVGVIMAVRRKYNIHRWIQSSAVTLNVLQVLTVMVGSFSKSASPGIPSKLNETYYALAVGHGLLGLTTLLLGVFIAIRANELLPPFLRFLRFHNFKLFMRTAYCLYMLSTAAGVALYVTWYTGKPAEPVAAQAEIKHDEVLVPMQGFAFNPEEVVVPLGGTVVWVNQDRAPHTATADDGLTFTSDLLSTGQSFRFTATSVGEFAYFCELHGSKGGDGMSGKLRVVAPADALVAAAQPAAQPTSIPTPTAEPIAQQTPRHAFDGIHQLLVEGAGAPFKQGYAVGLKNETQEMERHVRLLIQAESVGDMSGVRRHAEHVFNLVVGVRDPDFGDRDGDGHAQNAGDGFGLLANGNQPGYIRATLEAANAAAAADDATPSIKIHAGHIRAVAANLQGWATEARGLALDLTTVRDLSKVDPKAGQLLTLAKWLALGNDADGDGEISPIAGEGGAFVAYQHAQFMAGSQP
jgi:plastocyanin